MQAYEDLPVDLDRLLTVADEAAQRGARVVSSYGRELFGWRYPEERDADPPSAGLKEAREGGELREAKGSGDYVTAADLESEDAIRSFLEQQTSDIPVLAEERGGGTGDLHWAVDPVDGTTNFTLGMPLVAVSVALVHRGKPVVGVVNVPPLGLSFSAAAGRGAWLGSRQLRVSRRSGGKAILGTGLPLRKPSLLPRYLPAFNHLLRQVEDLRRTGVASLDLAWVAAGVFDGYFHLNLRLWDIAAGVLLIEEAGGIVTDWEGGSTHIETGNILAGSPEAHPILLRAAATAPREAGA